MAAVVVGVLAATGVPAFSPSAFAAEPAAECVSVVAGQAEAVELAVECQQPVEVLAARTPWDTLTAEPTGELTWTSRNVAEQAFVGGRWRPVDTTVVAGPGGVSPKAPVLPMTFSGGGDDAPLARVQHKDRVLEVFWPLGDLPAPEVSGSTVTYESVLPDVDLVVTVDEDGTGFSEVLVVETPQAAANPKLERLSFPVRAAGGLSVAEDSGGLTVLDRAGEEVFTSPTPLMWDSSGGAEPPQNPDASGEDAAAQRVVEPLDGDRVAEMPADVAGGAVTVVPEQEMLDDPDTAWPVYIDPTFDAGEGVVKNEWTMIAEAWPTETASGTYYKFTGSGGVGYCNASLRSDCVRSGRKRLVWEFTIPTAIRGAVVSAATFKAYKTHSYSCGDSGYHRLYRVNSISSSTNWSNHHAHWDDGGSAPSLDTQPPNGQCTGNEEWNAVDGVKLAAANSWSKLTLGLRSSNESSMPGFWRQYRNDATLSVTFNRYPNKPGLPSLDPAVRAGTGPSGYFVRDATPSLFASVSDPDGAYGQTVRGVFQVWTGSTKVWEGQSALVASGSTVSPSTQPSLSEGVLYTVRVFSKDASGLLSDDWSDFIQFKVDVTPPAALPVVVAQEVGTGVAAKYVQDGWAGAPGQTGKFEFQPNGVTDVGRYRYSFDSATHTAEVTAGTGGVSAGLVAYAPASPGLHTLRVWTVDLAGNMSEPRVYQMWVYAVPKAAWWLLDGTGADAAPGSAEPVTVSAGAGWVEGPLVGEYPTDQALHLDGVSVGATTAGPVVHTSGSFTITALVSTNELEATRTAASQDGVNTSGFALGQLHDASVCPAQSGPTCWVFAMAGQDVVGSAQTRVVAADPDDPLRFAVQPDTWTALAGVYDAGAHQLRLYVNGELAGSTAYTADWDAVGKLRIGSAMSGATSQHLWSGDLDDVRAYRAALDADTIYRVAQGSRDTADIPQ